MCLCADSHFTVFISELCFVEELAFWCSVIFLLRARLSLTSFPPATGSATVKGMTRALWSPPVTAQGASTLCIRLACSSGSRVLTHAAVSSASTSSSWRPSWNLWGKYVRRGWALGGVVLSDYAWTAVFTALEIVGWSACCRALFLIVMTQVWPSFMFLLFPSSWDCFLLALLSFDYQLSCDTLLSI